MEKKISSTTKAIVNGKKVIIINYDDGTTKTVIKDPLYR